MRIYAFGFFFLLLLCFACSDPEEPANCTLSDWEGSYVGTTVCGNASGEVTVVVNILADSTIMVELQTGLTTSFDPFQPAPLSCEFDETASTTSSAVLIEYRLRDDEIEIFEQFPTGSCRTTAIRE